MGISKSSSIGISASGSYRARSFLPWIPYKNYTVSEFEQASQSNPGPPYRTGGPWYMERTSISGTTGRAGTPEFSGTFYLGTPTNAEPPISAFTSLSVSQLNSTGGKLLIQQAPTHPSVDFATSIGELRSDGLPGLPGVNSFAKGYTPIVEERAKNWEDVARTARQQTGQEYLNIEFGWLPLVSDLKAFARSVKYHSRIIRAYKHEANVWVKRHVTLPQDAASQTISPSKIPVVPNGAGYFAYGNTCVTAYRDTWFEATYRFRMPLGDDVMSRVSRYEMYANKLFGLRLDPSTVWNLSPWSWAVDWFVDVGGVLDAVDTTSQDGLVVGSAYMMSSSRRTMTSSAAVTIAGMASTTLTRTDVWESKRRVAANPFGFGVSWDGLTSKQAAIAAAIGLSR